MKTPYVARETFAFDLETALMDRIRRMAKRDGKNIHDMVQLLLRIGLAFESAPIGSLISRTVGGMPTALDPYAGTVAAKIGGMPTALDPFAGTLEDKSSDEPTF